MTRAIICTVGTSLLTNSDRPWAGWRPRAPLPSIKSITTWLDEGNLALASAETTTLQALAFDGRDQLTLLHSDTLEGKLCAEALECFYTSRGHTARVRPIPSLGYGADHFTQGLKGLVDITLNLVREARESVMEPLFCATGGFKAEIAYLNLLGALLEVEVVYVYSHHRELVRLPRLPLTWNIEFVTRHADFFEWIEAELRRPLEVESWLKNRPELRSLVEDDSEGHTLLTAAGALLYKAALEQRAQGPRATWPEADARPPSEKDGVSDVPHHRPEGWARYVNRLCTVDCVTRVRFDGAARGVSRAEVLDAASGKIGVRFGEAGRDLPLAVETTARGAAQCELVANHLRKLK